MIDKNLAYSIKFFEEDALNNDNIIKFPKKMHKQKAKKQGKIIATVMALSIFVFISLIISIFLNSGVQLNELTDKENTLSKCLAEQKSLHTQLIVKKNALLLSKDLGNDIEYNNLEYIKVNVDDKSIVKSKS